MDFEKYFNDYRIQIEQHLDYILPPTDELYNFVVDAARYSLLGGGKRLRPLLTITAAETFGTSVEKTLNTACAIELIHTYSLIHDDLPCMDDDDFRRGKPSLHKAYDEAHAVLAGDLLLTKAFEVIAFDKNVATESKIELIKLLSKKSGSCGLIGGQSMDIQAEGRKTTILELQQIHKLKTGALFTASLVAGAIIGGATLEQKKEIEAFGDSIGLAFQIIDDVLDVTAGVSKRGGIVSSDLVNSKTTYVTLLGVDGAEQAAEELYNKAQEHLLRLGLNTAPLAFLSKRLVERKF